MSSWNVGSRWMSNSCMVKTVKLGSNYQNNVNRDFTLQKKKKKYLYPHILFLSWNTPKSQINLIFLHICELLKRREGRNKRFGCRNFLLISFSVAKFANSRKIFRCGIHTTHQHAWKPQSTTPPPSLYYSPPQGYLFLSFLCPLLFMNFSSFYHAPPYFRGPPSSALYNSYPHETPHFISNHDIHNPMQQPQHSMHSHPLPQFQQPQHEQRHPTPPQKKPRVDDEGEEYETEDEVTDRRRKNAKQEHAKAREITSPIVTLSFTSDFMEGKSNWDHLVVEYPSAPQDPSLAQLFDKCSSTLSTLTIRNMVSTIVRKSHGNPSFEKKVMMQQNYFPKNLTKIVCRSGGGGGGNGGGRKKKRK